MTSVSERIAELLAPDNSVALRVSALRQLPGGMESPTVSNERGNPRELEPVAWLSWSGPAYDPDRTFDSVAILSALEAAGWRTMPATLCKWDDYRPSTEYGLQSDIPVEKSSGRSMYRLSDSWPICPLWVTPEQHCGPRATCYMRAPSGDVFLVMVAIPGVPCSVWATRKETRGEWHYGHGTARLQHPAGWYEIRDTTGATVAEKSEQCFACVDTPHGLSGRIVWNPLTAQDAFPLTAAEMLSALYASMVETA